MFGDPVDNPMDWPMRKLSDVAKVDGTMTKEYEKYANYPHIGIDSIEKNTGILSGYRTVQEDNVISPKYYFGPQHILYSKIRPALNKVALPDFEGLCSADCYPLLVTGMCDRKFLAHVMRSDYFLDYVLSYSGRSQMPKVNRKQLEGFTFPCPPIELQEKFTVLIEQSDKSKFTGFKSQFIEMFGEPYSENEKWPTEPFGELTNSFNNTRKPVKEGDRRNMQGPYPYYGATGIVDYVNDYRLDGTYLLISEDGKALEFRNYDIAFIVTGKIWVNNHAHVVQSKGKVSLEYLQYYFKYLDISDWVSGIDQKKLNRANLDIIPIMVPPEELITQFDEFVYQSDKSK